MYSNKNRPCYGQTTSEKKVVLKNTFFRDGAMYFPQYDSFKSTSAKFGRGSSTSAKIVLSTSMVVKIDINDCVFPIERNDSVFYKQTQ